MSDEAPPEWADEIRAYMLGRVQRAHDVGALPARVRTGISAAPIRRWWLFEGKRYRPFDAPLQAHWDYVVRAARALLRSFSPAWRVSDQPDGMVDWGRTLARGPEGGRREFVVQSSRVGIDDDERTAIVGWVRWIGVEWQEYCGRFGIQWQDVLQPLRAFGDSVSALEPTTPQLRRWAHVARRSRWPVLREIVAETLRVMIEPQDVERVPLPTVRSDLFELLCFVRVARSFARQPDALRWIDRDLSDNCVELPGVSARYQWSLGRDRMLASSEYHGGLADAVRVFDASAPDRVDLFFRFHTGPRRGFHGILVEAKSGDQDYGSAVHQLKAYRAAIPRSPGERFLIWGVVEKAPALSEQQLDWLRHQRDHALGDVWAFCGVDDVPRMLAMLFVDAVVDATGTASGWKLGDVGSIRAHVDIAEPGPCT